MTVYGAGSAAAGDFGCKTAPDGIQLLVQDTDLPVQFAGCPSPLGLADPGRNPADQHAKDEEHENQREQGQRRLHRPDLLQRTGRMKRSPTAGWPPQKR